MEVQQGHLSTQEGTVLASSFRLSRSDAVNLLHLQSLPGSGALLCDYKYVPSACGSPRCFARSSDLHLLPPPPPSSSPENQNLTLQLLHLMDFSQPSAGFWLPILLPLQLLATNNHHQPLPPAPALDQCFLFVSVLLLLLCCFLCFNLLISWSSSESGGWAWKSSKCTIPGPRGLPFLGSLLHFRCLQPHRRLARLAARFNPQQGLIALSLGSTRLIIASKPAAAREILSSPCFADRPLKQSAQELLFGRAIGFAPQGDYWRGLRRIASSHIFSPKKIAAQEHIRQFETDVMISSIAASIASSCAASSSSSSFSHSRGIFIRPLLQQASLNNIMRTVFGVRYDFTPSSPGGRISQEAEQLQSMVREGFELLGAFNWADFLPALRTLDPHHIHQRCLDLVQRVNAFVGKIIQEHRLKNNITTTTSTNLEDSSESDFVDVLLALQGQDKLQDQDIVAVLWEMIFRGTDTTAILTEWVLAELVLHPNIQQKIHAEIDAVVGHDGGAVRDEHIQQLPYLQAVVKETLRLHPPGPLLSWSRLCTQDSLIAGHHVPKGTNAMVNMWAITHDSTIWSDAECFKPERFLEAAADSFDVKGSDLRLAPFGSGRRVCPGRLLGLATVHLWIARLLQEFSWNVCPGHPVELDEVLKLSSEMAKPLKACPVRRRRQH